MTRMDVKTKIEEEKVKIVKLKRLKVRNFRGYKEEAILNVDDMTALIGKNDAGKSTLLEALEIFFNNKVVCCEKEDLNIGADDENIDITCVFYDFPETLTIDSSSTTSLAEEYLLNEEGQLEIKKTFKATAAKPKTSVSIICMHPSVDNYNDLLSLNQNELKRRVRDLGIDDNEYDARNNVSMRNAIRNMCGDLDLTKQELDMGKAGSKEIYSVLETYLPVFALFQSDRNSNDSDKEVTDPMQIAVSHALQDVETEINTIKSVVKQKALDTATRTLEKLREMDSELASSLMPEFKSEPKFNSLFKLTIQSDNGISINKRGSGVRRLILLNFFRAEAERKLSENERNHDIIYAFEEPETSQHPSHQEMLMKSFIELSQKDNCQVILTTHTPSLGGLLGVENLRFVTKDNDRNVIKSGNNDTYKMIAETLGVLPEVIPQNTRGIILIEGKADFIFLNHLCQILKEAGDIDSTFEDKNIALIPTGGCNNLKMWITLQVVDQFNLPWGLFMDSDKRSENDENKTTEDIDNIANTGIIAITTKKREIENYLHPDIFDQEVTISDYNNVKKEVNSIYNTIGKDRVLETFWPLMTLEQIRETETYICESGEQRQELTEAVEKLLTICE